MCGIVGRLNFQKDHSVLEESIKQMMDQVKHRGPDDEGIFLDANIGLGFRRLAIIDLSAAGHQPMSDEEGRIHLIFNGEIYNFLSLRKELESQGVQFRSNTDTEVIIYLYKKYGIDCLQYLRGMFAFAIWDKRKRVLFIARDRLGKKPVKYFMNESCFIFASELKALFVNEEVPKQIDWGAIDEYLSYQYVPHPKTGFAHIQKLEPAHYLFIKESGEVIKKRYWQLDFSRKDSFSYEEWKEQITDSLQESVRLRLTSDVALGAHLSGGIDSSLIVALMASQMKEPVKTFSIGFQEETYNELPRARLVAQRYATQHQEFVVESHAAQLLPTIAFHLEEPFADSSVLPTWILCELTKQSVTVALNGDGGDENFAGYARYKAMQRYEFLRFLDPFITSSQSLLTRGSAKLFEFTGKKRIQYLSSFFSSYTNSRSEFYVKLWGSFTGEEKRRFYAPALAAHISSSRDLSILDELFARASRLHKTEQLMFVDIHSYLPDDLLVKTDLASMAHALEVRSPMLDHEFMQLVAHAPADLKLHQRQSKYILRDIAKDWIPAALLQQPKRGFSPPLESWLRFSLHAFVREQLLDPVFLQYGFNGAAVKELLERHKKGENHSAKLWSLMMLRLWLAAWFEG